MFWFWCSLLHGPNRRSLAHAPVKPPTPPAPPRPLGRGWAFAPCALLCKGPPAPPVHAAPRRRSGGVCTGPGAAGDGGACDVRRSHGAAGPVVHSRGPRCLTVCPFFWSCYSLCPAAGPRRTSERRHSAPLPATACPQYPPPPPGGGHRLTAVLTPPPPAPASAFALQFVPHVCVGGGGGASGATSIPPIPRSSADGRAPGHLCR